MQKTFSNQIPYGFKKTYSTQHACFRLLQLWPREVDEPEFFGTTLMDLSKVYGSMPHGRLIAKLEAYGLHKNSLNLIAD